MADQLRVTLEIGPKAKKVVAVAADWPGLERGAKTGEAAIERLLAYVPRYARVAKLAGMEARVCDHSHRRGCRSLSGHWLNRLLGYLVRVFEHRPASHAGRSLGA